MDANKTSGVKRSMTCENIEELLSSKLAQIGNRHITIGSITNAEGNARVSSGNTNIFYQQKEQPIPSKPPQKIELQLNDPISTFRGRKQTFKDVKNAFNQQKDNMQFNLVAVCGYGGIGKTQFARMFIMQNREEFQNVIWIFAESETTMKDSFIQLQNQLTDKGYRCYNNQDVYEYLNSELTIFVFDNSADIRSIQSFLPAKQNKSLFLVTSKSKNWDVFNIIELKLLDVTEAEDIMKAVLVEKHKIQISNTQLREITTKFEPIPLVLQIRAGYICRQVLISNKRGKQYNISNIVNELNTHVTDKFHNFILDTYNKTVFTAISQTLEKIWNEKDEASIIAAKMLGISAYLKPDNINENVLKGLIQIESETLMNDSLDILDQFSLFQISDSVIAIHRTVQECLRYHHTDIIKSDEYYRLTLPALLNVNVYHEHYDVIFNYGEKNLEALCIFYQTNKCNVLHQIIALHAPLKILKLLLHKTDLIRNPDFLSEAIKWLRDNIEILRDFGADFNIKDELGLSALFYACLQTDKYDNRTIDSVYYGTTIWKRIKALIANGADVNSQNDEGNTVIHNLNLWNKCAEQDKNLFDICALMIQVGANPEIKNNAGLTAVDLARMHGLTLTFQLFNEVISGYRYISHIAAKNKQFYFMHWLIVHEVCQMNDRDDSGCTVLHVLASLTQLDQKDENKLLDETLKLLENNWNFRVLNNAGELPSDVARRCGCEKLTDLMNAWVQPGLIIYRKALHHIQHFRYVKTEDEMCVNEVDDNDLTLLHVLCDLDSHGDIALELDIVKFVIELVIRYDAGVCYINQDNVSATNLARRRGRLLLADFLDLVMVNTPDDYEFWNERKRIKRKSVDLVYVAVRHKQFDLAKYVWWRYIYLLLHNTMKYTTNAVSPILHTLCKLEDHAVSDEELISLLDYMNLKGMDKYCNDPYDQAVLIAQEHGRRELAAWLQLGS